MPSEKKQKVKERKTIGSMTDKKRKPCNCDLIKDGKCRQCGKSVK